MKRTLKSFLCLLLCISILSCNLSFAQMDSGFQGVTYNLYTMEQEDPLQNVSIELTESQVTLSISKGDVSYDVIATKTDDNIYDGSCYVNDVEYFCRIINTEGNFSGLFRELDPNKQLTEVDQFGFIIQRKGVQQITDDLNTVKNDGTVSEVIDHNEQMMKPFRK